MTLDMQQLEQRDQALTVACPDQPKGCGAQPNEPCRNLHTGDELYRVPAHPARLIAAEVPLQPLTELERRLPRPGQPVDVEPESEWYR